MRKIVVTISREFGSGGRKIGELLAQSLGISFYDKALIDMAAEKSGLSKEFIESREQQMNSSLLYMLTMNNYYSNAMLSKDILSPQDSLFITQGKLIKSIAEKESCVIVGRCADYILRKRDDCLNLFIYADMENKVKRAVEEYGIAPDNAENELRKNDKARATHYHHYTGRSWGDVHNYHMCLSSSMLGVEGTAAMLKAYVNKIRLDG